MASGKEPAASAGDVRARSGCSALNSPGSIRGSRKWKPTPVFLFGKFHGPGSPQSMGSQRATAEHLSTPRAAVAFFPAWRPRGRRPPGAQYSLLGRLLQKCSLAWTWSPFPLSRIYFVFPFYDRHLFHIIYMYKWFKWIPGGQRQKVRKSFKEKFFQQEMICFLTKILKDL